MRSRRARGFPGRSGKGRGADCRTGPQARRGGGAALRADLRAPDRRRAGGARQCARDAVQPLEPAMSMPAAARQARPEITLAVCRGACRLMRQAGHSVLLEMPLPDGRRADIFAGARGGEITIVEVKSSIEDWRVDEKWPDYLGWCDQLYFAVPIGFPQPFIPGESGLIVAR